MQSWHESCVIASRETKYGSGMGQAIASGSNRGPVAVLILSYFRKRNYE